MKTNQQPQILWVLCTTVALFCLLLVPQTVWAQSSTMPVGHLDQIDGNRIVRGWALDSDAPSQSIAVHFYIDGQFVESTNTSVLRQDVNNAYGVTGLHGYEWTIPERYSDGSVHTLSVYGINVPVGNNPELYQSPRQFSFAPTPGTSNVPIGHVDAIDGNMNVIGWALDLDTLAQPIAVHIYVDNVFVESVTTTVLRQDVNNEYGVSGMHGFIWNVPSQFRNNQASHVLSAYAINQPADPSQNRQLIGSPRTLNFGDAQISNMAGASPITIKTTARLAGAIDSLTWGGVEFIDSYDHGRQMQSASNFDGLGECFNPTEAGSDANSTGPMSTSRLQAISEAGNVLQTQTQMAFWLEPAATSTLCNPGDAQRNTTALSDHILNKKVTIGFRDMPHVIEYLVQYNLPPLEPHVSATFEATTAYLPLARFNTFWTYDPNSEQLNTIQLGNDQPGATFPVSHTALPVIISSTDGNYAMGVYSPELPNDGVRDPSRYYALFAFANEAAPVSKWSCVFHETNIPAGSKYNYGCYVAVGTLENVRVSIDQLYTYFQSNTVPTATPTASSVPAATPTPILTPVPQPTVTANWTATPPATSTSSPVATATATPIAEPTPIATSTTTSAPAIQEEFNGTLALWDTSLLQYASVQNGKLIFDTPQNSSPWVSYIIDSLLPGTETISRIQFSVQLDSPPSASTGYLGAFSVCENTGWTSIYVGGVDGRVQIESTQPGADGGEVYDFGQLSTGIEHTLGLQWENGFIRVDINGQRQSTQVPYFGEPCWVNFGAGLPQNAHVQGTLDNISVWTESAAEPAIWQPTLGTTWQIQLQGAIDASFVADVYEIDLFDTPQRVIDDLHSMGRRVICYFSAGTREEWRQDADAFPVAVIGNDMADWEGEQWLDIRQIDLLTPIMRARLDRAVSKGCDGVDPDNVDAYANPDTSLSLTYQDQLAYNRWLAEEAHQRGLAIGLKNDLAQIDDLVSEFDFAVNEQCFFYNECNYLLPFCEHNKAVFGIEYQGNIESICAQALALNFDWLYKDIDLGAESVSCQQAFLGSDDGEVDLQLNNVKIHLPLIQR